MTWQQQQFGRGAVGARGGGHDGSGGFSGRGQQQYNSGDRQYSSQGGRGRGRGRGRGAKMQRTDSGSDTNGSRFFKMSFLTDPWEPLMKQLWLEQQQQQQQQQQR
jgi:hypothetical protein